LIGNALAKFKMKLIRLLKQILQIKNAANLREDYIDD
jgi:hypothetical protein